MITKKRVVVLVLVMVFLIGSIFTGYASKEKGGLLIPIGRLLVNHNQVQLSMNSKPFEPEVIGDGSGGFWFRIPFDKLQKKDKIDVRIVKTNSKTLLYEENIDQKRWTAASVLINSNNPGIQRKAKELTQGCLSNHEKAKKILDFVVQQIKFQTYPGMHYSTASETLHYGYGICVNHSRLFVALCQATGVPARTVSGTMASDKNVYTHHEWAEFYDDNRNWHSVEPLFSLDIDFADLKRIDLVYDIESNPVYSFVEGWETDRVKLKNGDVSIFCTNWGLQRLNGQMSYQMMDDKSPESVEVMVEYDMSKYIE